MAAEGGAAVSAFLQVLCEDFSAIIATSKLSLVVNDELGRLLKAFHEIPPTTVEAAEDQALKSKLLRAWLRELKEVAYDAADLLDHLDDLQAPDQLNNDVMEEEVIPRCHLCCIFHSCCTLGSSSTLQHPADETVRMISALRKRVKKLMRKHSKEVLHLQPPIRRCRQPGYLMRDCRRVEICRRCECPGYRVAQCRMASPEMGTINILGERHPRERVDKQTTMGNKASNTDLGVERRRKEQKPPHKKTLPEEEKHHIALAVDSKDLEGKVRLNNCTIATSIKVMEGFWDHKKVRVAMADRLAPEKQWTTKTYDDNWILIYCHFAELSREIEGQGELKFPTFITRFTGWTTDVDSTVRATVRFDGFPARASHYMPDK
ncbi:hypothetical protein J5N97_001060 [Dioscorea zingiberensis]|uniref:Disease resistance N-terminal domain-containing protein n=1 Tax=Dioscorea zingiberensis TaxID=325984 RepID=A0A9D5BUE0_9LILI|nr:hypothetical protein J5N97_001060 [Dioscorea zingiberensis]